TAGVGRGLHAELARGVGAEEVALQHALAHHRALARGDAFVIERRARRPLAFEGPLLDLYTRREHFLAEGVEEEAGLAIEVAAVHGGDEVADEADGRRRLEEHRRLARGDLACAQARG